MPKYIGRFVIFAFLSLMQCALASHPFEVIDEKIAGIGAFASRVNDLLEENKDMKIGFIIDVDGVITNRSYPDDDQDTHPRGDIVEFIKYLDSLPNVKIAVSSAWSPINESLERLSAVGLVDTLELAGWLKDDEMQLGKSLCDVVTIGKFAAIRRTSWKEGMINDKEFYRQKALAFDAIYGSCNFDLVIVLEDSRTNLNNIKGTTKYAGDITEASFYSNLKKLVLFQIPEIKGEQRDEDKIIEMVVESQPGSQSGYLADIDEPYSQYSQPFSQHSQPLSQFSFPQTQYTQTFSQCSQQFSQPIALKRSCDSCGREEANELKRSRTDLVDSQ